LGRDSQAVVTSNGPGMEGAPLLGALLAGARLGMLDPLTRAEHLWQPFHEELETAETFTGLDPLTATVMRLWCVGQTVPVAAVTDALDEETVAELVEARLLRRVGDGLVSPWRVITFLQRQLLVTPPAHAVAFRPEDPVAYVGQESLFFAPFVAGAERCDRALDVCAGAGLLSVLSPGREVVAVEVDPFAAEVARFNVVMGGHDHVSVVEGDLFGPVAGERFDLVTANPPFLPAPAGVSLPVCGDGGPTGDGVLRRLLGGLEEHLTSHGRALVYGEDLGPAEEPGIAAWLREDGALRERDVTVYLTSSRFNDRTALRLTDLWQACGASEEDAWTAWNELTAGRPSSHHHGFIIDVRPGPGRLVVRDAEKH